MVTMVLGGMWHGASWNFIWWGIYHGAILCLYRVFGAGRNEQQHAGGVLRGALQSLLMFHLTLLGWLLFRATRRVPDGAGGTRDDSWFQILELLGSLGRGFGDGQTISTMSLQILVYAGPLMLVQAFQYRAQDLLVMRRWPMPLRAVLIALMLLTWILYGVQEGAAFIYFQF